MTAWNTVLSGIREDVEEPVASIFSDASILRHYNDAARDFAKKVRPWEDEEYAGALAGQASYSLPTGTIDVKAVYFNGDDEPLTRLNEMDFTYYQQQPATGDPDRYLVSDGALWLYPTPDVSGTIRFFRTCLPAEVTETSGTTAFDSQYDFILTKYVKARLYEQLGDYMAADRLTALYNDDLQNAEWQTIRTRTADMSTLPRQTW
jgi:hypothetical protein